MNHSPRLRLFEGRFAVVAMAALAFLLAVGGGGCSERGSRVLGTAVDGAPVPIASLQPGESAAPVVVAGRMTEKCPVAGCWFMLRDASGTIKVDTKGAGFVVVDVPTESAVVVAGRVSTNGSERVIEATGLRY